MIFKKKEPAQAPPGMKFVAFKTCVGNGLEAYMGISVFPEDAEVDEWGRARGDHFSDQVMRPIVYFLPGDAKTEKRLEKIKRELLKRVAADQSYSDGERELLKRVNGHSS